MTIRKTFYILALLFVLPAAVSAMNNDGIYTDSTTTTTSSGSYNDDGSVGNK